MMKINQFFQLKQWTLVLVGLFCMFNIFAQVVTCPPNLDLGSFDCNTIESVPPQVNSIADALEVYGIEITGALPETGVTTRDSEVVFYCEANARNVTREVIVFNDGNNNFQYDTGEEVEICTFTISTVPDTTAPVFTAPGDFSTTCAMGTDPEITGFPDIMASDGCPDLTSDNVNKSDAPPTQGGCAGEKIFVSSWTATDPCGNANDPQTQVITILDDTGPEFTVPDDITVPCGTDPMDVAITGDVTDGFDECEGVAVTVNGRIVADLTQEDTPCAGSTTYTKRWGAIDGCENVNTKDQIIVVECPADCTNDDICAGDRVTDPLAGECECQIVEVQVLGCDDPAAQNFDPAANCTLVEDCSYAVAGCAADPCAPNFNPDATEDDGSCDTTYSTACNEDCTAGNIQVWDATTCSCVTDVVTIVGCTDPEACNYNSGANCPDDSCIPFPVCNDDICLGDITELTGSESCTCTLVEQQVLGCNDAAAQNYNPDANCDDGSCIYGPLCSYTQGFWGNIGGKKDGLTTTEMIDIALESAGGSFVIGAEGQSLTISSAKCVLSLLPSTGGPRALKAGDEVYEGNCPQNKNGRIKNRLAAETLVLTLNTLTSPGLNNVVLCDPENCLLDRVPDSVCDALGDSGTIADLLVLANETLGGIIEVADRGFYSDVNEAINVISERYNDCKNPCGDPREKFSIINEESIYLDVQPNPANQFLNIGFVLEEPVENIKLEIYQFSGQKVAEKEIVGYKGEQTTYMDVLSLSQGIYMVSLNINGSIYTQKFIKENM